MGSCCACTVEIEMALEVSVRPMPRNDGNAFDC